MTRREAFVVVALDPEKDQSTKESFEILPQDRKIPNPASRLTTLVFENYSELELKVTLPSELYKYGQINVPKGREDQSRRETAELKKEFCKPIPSKIEGYESEDDEYIYYKYTIKSKGVSKLSDALSSSARIAVRKPQDTPP